MWIPLGGVNEESDMANVKPGYIAEKQAHLNRLKRIEGQVRGIQRMVD